MSGRRREEEEPGIQNQKQEPHTKMWGTNINKPCMKQLDCPDSSILLVIVLVGLGVRSFRIFQDHQQDGPNVLN